MASLPMRAQSGLAQDSNTSYASHAKIRGRTIVKPILKKLNSHSNSDRGSLDLDPVWDEQPSPLGYTSADYDTAHGDTPSPLTPGGVYNVSAPGSNPDFYGRQRDVSFSTSVSGDYPTWRSKNKYSHMRSTSGTSHASSVATNVSARNGTFVHPFQQTPRAATPSLSYANSIASLDTSAPPTREYAATIAEQDDAISQSSNPLRSASFTRTNGASPPPPYSTTSRFRGPSLDESRLPTAPSDGSHTPRIQASRSNSATTALYLPESAPADSVLSTTTSQQIAPILTSMSSSATPSSPSPLSPLRNSLDISGFRLRSRSEVDTRTHQEQVRDARRKFQEKERAKDEKYARQQTRRRERADQKGDRAKIRKSTTGSTSTAKSSATSSRHAPGSTEEVFHEKPDFTSSAYDHTASGQTPARADEVQFQRPKRRKSAKHKTNGVWTAFMLWFRTRLLRLGKH